MTPTLKENVLYVEYINYQWDIVW